MTVTATVTTYHRSDSDKWVQCEATVEECPKEHIKTDNPEQIKPLAEELNKQQAGGTFANVTRKRKPSASAIKEITGNIDDSYPYPQANDLEKVDTVLESIDKGANSSAGVGDAIADDRRRTVKAESKNRDGHYYVQAAGYLGFVEKQGGGGTYETTEYALTDLGRSYLTANSSERSEILRGAVNNMPAVQAYRNAGGGERGRQAAEDAMQDKAGGDTARRRSSTVEAWVNTVDSEDLDTVVTQEQERTGANVQQAIANDAGRRKEREKKRQERAQREAEKQGAQKRTEKTCSECFMVRHETQFTEDDSICDDCMG